MNGHPQFDEDFDLYAIGALDAGERREMEAHIKTCMDCARRLAAAQGRAAVFALAAPQEIPPARIKQQLMSRVREQSGGKTPAKKRSSLVTLWSRPVTAWSLVAVFAGMAAFFAITSYHLNEAVHQYRETEAAQRATIARANSILAILSARDTEGITLTALPEKPQPTGRVLYHPEHGLIFYAQNMPAPPPDRVYQLWLVPPHGDPISAGIFSPDAKGTASIVLPPLPKGVPAKAFAVTVEPEGGVPKATGPKVLAGTA
jgi:anti-sigma-K factor RskA